MQRTGEQQEAQHPVHQGLIKIDLAKHASDLLCDVNGGLDQIKCDNRQRSGKRDDDEPYRVWQAQKSKIDIAEQGRKAHKDRTNAEYAHRYFFSFPNRILSAIPLIIQHFRPGIPMSAFC